MLNLIHNIFSKAPGSQFHYYIPVALIGALLIIGGLFFGRIYKKRKNSDFAFKRLFKKVSFRSISLGFVILILLACRYENIPYFSMRLWLYLSLLLTAYLIFHYLRIYKKIYPTEKINVENKRKSPKKNSKYLPNKKKR